MAGIQGIGANGIQGLGQNGGIQGLDGGLGAKGSPSDQIKQLFEQIVKKLLEGGQAEGGKAQGAQQAQAPQGAQEAGPGGGMSLQDLMEQLKKMAKENPEAFKQALGQNPAFMAVAQAALGGGNGGGAIGGAK